MELTFTGCYKEVDEYNINGFMEMYVNDTKCGTHYGSKTLKIQKITGMYGVSYTIMINSHYVWCDDYYFTKNGIRMTGCVF